MTKIQCFPESKMISSRPWTIQLITPQVKPTTTLKRKKVSTTTTTAAAQPEASRGLTESSTATSQSEVKAVTPSGKVKTTVQELEWPFGGGGVKWVELEGEERRIKGSAVVEQEEEQQVTERHRVFEEIFDFSK